MKAWKGGKLVDCSAEEFTQSLHWFAGWADQHFILRSDSAAQLGERLNAAANEIDRLRAVLQRIVDEAESDDGMTAWDASDLAREALSQSTR